MTQSLVFSIQLDNAKRLEETLEENTPTNHREAARASDMDFLVAHCSRMVEMLDWGWDMICREAVSGILDDKAKIAGELQNLFNAVLDSARRVWEKAVRFSAETEINVEGLDDLESILKVYERKRDNYLFRLNLIDKGIVVEALNAQTLGDYTTPAAALADLLAARQAEKIAPPYSILKQWSDRSPAPASWQSETDDSD